MFIRRSPIFLSCFLSGWFFSMSVQADDETLELSWELDGLETPESVIYDPKRKQLYVSNMKGGSDEKNGTGYISIVSLEERKTTNKNWITGLNAPKGLAIHDGKLYTADIDTLVVIDIDKGQVIKKYKVDDAKFLNDVAADDKGNVYVSDMVLNRIHVLQGDDFSIWLESEQLESPNGLLVWGKDLILGSWGKMTDGFQTKVPGHLKRISLSDKSIKSIGAGTPIGNLDGVEGDKDGDFYVTDWMNGKLYHIEHDGTVDELLDLNQGSADHEFIMEQDLMLIPMMKDDKLLVYKVHHK